jgi:protein PhnA
MTVRDSNGNELNEGDAVQVIKDLKVKGSSIILKRGKLFKSIHLTSDDEEVECREGKTTIVLKTCFLKKA